MNLNREVELMTVDNRDYIQSKAFDEIQQVIQKYDLAAFVSLHDKDGGTFRPFFPTWCQVTFREKRDGGVALHMRVNPSAEDGQDSIVLLLGLRDITLRASAIYENVATSLARHLNVDLVNIVGGVDKPVDQESQEGAVLSFPGTVDLSDPKS